MAVLNSSISGTLRRVSGHLAVEDASGTSVRAQFYHAPRWVCGLELRRELFTALDTDSSGGIDADELARGLAARGYTMTRDEARTKPAACTHHVSRPSWGPARVVEIKYGSLVFI